MRYVELFAGAGALSMGLERAGMTCVGHAEIEPHARAVLRHHWPDVPLHGDVSAVDWTQYAGRVDLVAGGSPCFTAGHLVLTRRGLIPIEHVVVGDVVWTHLHRWRPVTHTMTRDADVVEMRGQGHNAMTATPDHPFWAADTESVWNGSGYTRHLRAPHWVAAAAMRGKRWATPLRVNAEQPVPEPLASEAMAYFAGLYLGDGHIARSGQKAKVVLSVNHGKADAFHGALQETFGTVTRLPHTASTDRLEVSRTAIAFMLQEHFGTLAHRKTLPLWALSAPKPWQRALLQGVLDTDGGKTPAGWRVTTVSRALAVGLRLLAARLGYSTSLNFCKRPVTTTIQGRVVSQRDTWEVVLRDTARTSELRDHDYVWGLVRSVQTAGRAQVFDITVDQDHSFVCDGLVVHNCQDLSVAGKRAGLAGARSNLFYEQLRAWVQTGAPYLLWENVLGAFSANRGADFAAVLSALVGGTLPVPADGWQSAGVAAGATGVAAWRVFDLQHFGPPQRRRRVFVLAARAGGCDPAEILAVHESLCGHPAPRERQRQDAAAGAGGGADRVGVIPIGEVTARQSKATHGSSAMIGQPGDAMFTLTSKQHGVALTVNNDSRAEVVQEGTPPLRAGHRQQPAVFAFEPRYYTRDNKTGGAPSDLVKVDASIGKNGDAVPHVLAFHATQDPISGDVSPALGRTTEGMGVLAFEENQRGEIRRSDTAQALAGGGGKPGQGDAAVVSVDIAPTLNVGAHTAAPGSNGQDALQWAEITTRHTGRPRRLMPVECERLMGWPDHWTATGTREDGTTYALADTARYRLCGNGVGTPVAAWIARRLVWAEQHAEDA